MKKIFLFFMAFSFAFFVKAQQLDINAAKQLVIKNSAAIGMSVADLKDFRVSNAYSNEGVQMVYLLQDYKGLPVFNQMLVLQFKGGSLSSNAGAFLPDLDKISGNASSTPGISAASAVKFAFQEVKIAAPTFKSAPQTSENGRKLDYGVLAGVTDNVKAELLWVPVQAGSNASLKLSWTIQVVPAGSADYWLIQVDAASGKIIGKINLTVYDKWEKNTPGILKARAPLQTGAPVQTGPSSFMQNRVAAGSPSIINSASYLVIPYPAESPIHPGGTAAIRTDPWTHAPGNATTLKWHSNGTADYNITRGNNVWATEDRAATDQNSGLPATSSTPDPLTFNFPPNYNVDPTTAAFQQFAITNLFYWNNNMHDIGYQYGFNEVSANFQNNNLGRGGNGGDDVIALCQSGTGTNNANFSAPADGGRGRMRMYLFDAVSTVTLHVNSPANLVGNYTAVESNFSTNNKLATVGPITGDLVYFQDNAGNNGNLACSGAAANNLTGKIAVINRGTCNFTVKVKAAQDAGARAVIMVNNVAGAPIIMGGTDNTITIPAVMISIGDGAIFSDNLPINATLSATTSQRLDGDLDAGVMCHEYTHGISNRLTGGGTSTCLGNAEQGGEGWSDYLGLMMTTNWATATVNDGPIARGIGTYVEGQPYTGPGIRNYPYSTNIAVNPLTYANMGTGVIGTEVHNIGEIWCMACWEMTWAIIGQTNSINTDLYNYSATSTGGNTIALKLVIEGMRLQPCSPGYIDARNAILKADRNLYCGSHACVIWTAFAKRGMGYGASQGSSNSATDQTATTTMPPAPTIVTQPQPVTVAGGATATFTANAGSDVNLIYQWQVSTDNGVTWTDISCQIASTLTLTNVQPSMNGYKYRAKVYIGCLSTLTTAAGALLTVTGPAAPVITLSSAAATSSQTVCINTAITSIVYTTASGATNVTVTGLPAGVTGTYSGGTNGNFTINGTPTVSGSFPYTVTATNGTTSSTITGTITVNANTTIALTSASSTTAQTVCVNTPIINIVYTVANGGTGAAVSGLPAGVSGTYAGGVFTISGAPTVTGTFPYTVTSSGGCGTAALSGTITVNGAGTLTLTSGSANQSVTINTPITNITYNTGNGVTGATVSGLPAGVTGTYSGGTNGTVTISGTPTVSGTFNYTVTTTGGCGAQSLGGTIIVTTGASITLTSAAGTSNQTVCTNTPITNIVYATSGGATGASVTAGALPAGVTGVYSGGTNGTFTISGTPSATGTFNYTISTSGGVGTASLSGTITVNGPPSAPGVTSPVTYCQNATATPLTATGSSLLFYTTATGGTGVSTLTPSTTTVGSTTYYVSQTIGCESPRSAIVVTINATPAAPGVTTPISYCQNATASPLTATGSNLLYYTTATGGTGVATLTPSTTTVGSTTYYVSQATGSCVSPRAAIVVNINAATTAPSVTTPVVYCQGAPAVPLTATGISLLYYTTATGGTGTATAPTPSTATAGNTTYYVSQTSACGEGPRAAITVTVNALPPAPTVTSPVSYCQNSTASPITATGTGVLYYTTATGGTGTATAPTPSTATAGTTTYYASQTTSTCEGPRAAIVITINPTPAAPAVTTPINYCQGSAAVPLAVTGTNVLYYTTATGGTGTATAPTPSTATVGSTTYYVSQTTGACESPRAAIVVNITTGAAITVQPVSTTSCSTTATFNVTATGTNLSYQWQVSTNGGITYTNIPGANSASYTITNLTAAQANNLYRVIVSAAGCGMVTSNSVIAHVGTPPSVVLTASPSTMYNPSLNGGLFTTVSPVGNYVYQWKRDGVILPILGSSVTASDGLLYDFGTYQVTVFDVATGCSGVSNTVTITDLADQRSHLFASPNPTTGMVHVSYYSSTTDQIARTITVYDSKGARAMNKDFTVTGRYGTMDLDLSRMVQGSYMLILRDATGKRIASAQVIKY